MCRAKFRRHQAHVSSCPIPVVMGTVINSSSNNLWQPAWYIALLLFFSCSVMSGCDPTDCSTPCLHVLHHLLELAQTHVHWVGDATNHLSSPSPAFIFPSIRVFSSESALHIRWPKYWSFSFSICLSNEYSELISFWIDWFDLLIVQGTLKSLLQHHSSRSSPLINPSRSTCLWIQAFHQGDHNHFL